MKAREMRELGACLLCGKRLAETGSPVFWMLSAGRFILDASAVQRHVGLGMIFNGNERLAEVMGTDEDLAKEVHDTSAMVCDSCLLERMPELLA